MEKRSKMKKSKIPTHKHQKPDKASLSDGDQSVPAVFGIGGNRVFVEMSKTVNLGNYESLRVSYGESRVVEDGWSFSEVRDEVVSTVGAQLMSMVGEVMEVAGGR